MSFFEELEALVKKERKRLGLEKLRAMKLDGCEPEIPPAKFLKFDVEMEQPSVSISMKKSTEPTVKPCPVCGKQPVRQFCLVDKHRVACGDHMSTEPIDTKLPARATVCTHNALKLDELLAAHPDGIPFEKAAPLETVCKKCIPSWIDRESRRLDAEDVAAWNAAVDAYEPSVDRPPDSASACALSLQDVQKICAEFSQRLAQAARDARFTVTAERDTAVGVIDEARQALRLDPRERLVDACRDLVEILGCPEDRHLTEWARSIVEERDAAIAHLRPHISDSDRAETLLGHCRAVMEKLKRAASDRDHNAAAVRRVIRERDELQAAFDKLDESADKVQRERDELRVQTSAVDKLLVDIAGIDRIEKIKGLLGRGLELAAVDEALGRCAGENRLTLLGKLLRRASERDGYRWAVASANEELLAVANALGAKTTGGLVELARSVKAAADGVEERYQTRCRVLEKRLAAIRATADGKADA